MRILDRLIVLIIVEEETVDHNKTQYAFCESMRTVNTIISKLLLLVKTTTGNEGGSLGEKKVSCL